jgi:quercetin dioxygenase-like cupin family protein
MKTIRLKNIEKSRVSMEGAKDVWRQVPISKNDGSPAFSFRVFTIEPEGHTPYHTHPFEHLNYVMSGQGALVNEQGQEQILQSGDFAIVLPEEKHQYRNKSTTEPFVMICAVPKEYE